MTEKQFLFVKTTITASDGSPTESWEMYSLGNSDLMHAAWNPEKQLLVCQYNSIKENVVPVPQVAKNGKFSTVDKRVQQYYRITIEDKDAIKYLLENLCANYDGQKWDYSYTPKVPEKQESIES